MAAPEIQKAAYSTDVSKTGRVMMKLKKELLFIAIAIVLLIGYLSVRETDRNEYRLPSFDKIAASDISRIEIARSEGPVILEKKDNGWVIQPKAYTADSGKVNTLLSDLEKVSLTALVSESKSYTRYDLDPDKVIRIKAWVGDALKRDIQIGKPASTFQHTFVRVGDGAEVYHAWQNLRTAFDQTADKLRDKTVLAYGMDEVKEVSIHREGKQVVIRKTEMAPAAEPAAPVQGAAGSDAKPAEGAPTAQTPSQPAEGAPKSDAPPKPAEVRWVTDEGKAADLSKMNKLLSAMSRLSCESYLEGKTAADLGAPIGTIVVKGNKDYTLNIYAKADKDAKVYPASSSESADVFTLSDFQTEPLLADPDTLFGSATKPESTTN
jgi:hypothetical protein